jgi:DNA repair protein SbcC/Rad50
MKPLRLTVQAFGPYAGEQVFDFADLRGRSFFLIHGPTGAGKTSVLDAICFALYGQTSGSLRSGRQMRSDHADAATLTRVVFEFAIGPDVYRVERQPEQERPKKRGTGTVVQDQEATLWRRITSESPEGEIAPVAGWAKVNEEVERLMGFQVDQFRQVVMLPQGQFQRLLGARSDERQGILESLFDVGTFGRIELALKESAAAARKQIEEARRVREEILRSSDAANPDELAGRRTTAEAELTSVRAAAAGLRAARAEANERLAAARQVAERLKEFDEARAAVRALEARHEEFARKETAHARACKASALVEVESSLRQRQKEAAEANRKLSEVRTTVQQAEAARAAADAALAGHLAAEPKRQAARQEVDRLGALEEKVLLLGQAQLKARTAAEQLGQRVKERDQHQVLLDRARQAVAAAEQKAKELEVAGAQLGSYQAANREAERVQRDRARLDEARAAMKAAQQAWQRAERKSATFGEQVTIARAALTEMEAGWRRGIMSHLARELADGSPCPVCGATHHPAPAASREDAGPPEAQVSQHRESVRRMEIQLEELRAESAAASGRVGELTATVRTYEEGLGAAAAADPDELRRATAKARADLERAEAAGLELQTVARGLSALRPQLSLAETNLQATEAVRARAEAELEAARAVVAEREGGIPPELRTGPSVSQNLTQAFRAASRRLKAMEEALEAARAAAQEADVARARAQAGLEAAETAAGSAVAQAEAAERAFAVRLGESGFDDAEAFRSAKLSDRQIEALEQEIRQFRVDLQAARARSRRAAEAAEGLTAPDLSALQAAARSAEAALEANVRREESLAQVLRRLDDSLHRLRALDAELASLDGRYQLVGQIAEVAGGKNEYRMTFQRYVLGVFLDEVLYAATERLKIMSRGRFLLQRVRDAATGRSAGGLDLEVHDTWTSTTRAVGTLSGGESFLASLALALGLADVVQAYAGGIRLETIFIDEGFGSLDPEALDLAIRALQDLQKGGRLVGIISHVTELKELIGARLEVLPGRRGSTARFVVA